MAKRKTKAQREAEQKAALRQRVADIMTAANYSDMDDTDGGETMLVENIPRLIYALKTRFPQLDTEDNDYLTAVYSVDEFETVESATNFLFDHGIRA